MQKANQPSIHPVVLSGGSGTRLWPLSRRACIPSSSSASSQDQPDELPRRDAEAARARGVGFAPPIVVCNNDHRFLVKDEAERAGVTPRAIVLEPIARNTAPAVAVAALLVAARRSRTAILAVMPSDHVIKDEPGFVAAVRQAAEIARPASSCCSASSRARRTPATATSGAARRSRLRRRLCRRRLHGEAEPRHRRGATSPPAATTGTAASSCFGARAFLERAGAPRARHPGGGRAGARRRAGGPGLPAARPRGLRASAQHLHRLCRDGAHRAGGRAADRHRLERRRLLVVAVGAERAQDADGNAVQGDALLEATRNCYVHSERVARRHPRRERPRHRRYARRAAGRRPRQGAGRGQAGRAAQGGGPHGARAARAQLPAVGLLRDAQPRSALPGQAAAREARRASSPCRCTITAPSTGWWCTAPPR